MSAAVNPHPRARYRADLDDAILVAAEELAARGQQPTAWRLSGILGESEATVRRHRNSLIARGCWRWAVQPGRPGRSGTGPCRVPELPPAARALLETAPPDPDLCDWERAVLAAAAALPAHLRADSIIAGRLGTAYYRVAAVRRGLIERGRWPYSVPEPIAPSGKPVGRDPVPTETEIWAGAADAFCTAFEGQCSPLLDDEAPAWRARPRTKPPDPAAVAEREAAESRRRIVLYRAEWKRLMRTWEPYRREKAS